MSRTLAINDDILRQLKRLARTRKQSLTQTANETLRAGLANRRRGRASSPFVQEVFDLGKPLVNLDKALQIAADLEDEEILRKMEAGK